MDALLPLLARLGGRDSRIDFNVLHLRSHGEQYQQTFPKAPATQVSHAICGSTGRPQQHDKLNAEYKGATEHPLLAMICVSRRLVNAAS